MTLFPGLRERGGGRLSGLHPMASSLLAVLTCICRLRASVWSPSYGKLLASRPHLNLSASYEASRCPSVARRVTHRQVFFLQLASASLASSARPPATFLQFSPGVTPVQPRCSPPSNPSTIDSRSPIRSARMMASPRYYHMRPQM